MPAAHAEVATSRASRYLTQLCQHVDRLSRQTDPPPGLRQDEPEHTPPATGTRVTWSDTAGVIDLGWGRCMLTAEDGALVLDVEAHDAADLHRLQALLGARLHRFGRRDDLTVDWQPAPVPTPRSGSTGAGRRGPHRTTAALVAVGVLVVALHVGLGAAAVGAPAWTSPALGVVLVVVVLKLLASLVLGRHMVHRRRRPPRSTSREAAERRRG